jgi:hypothetical protein
VIHHTNVVVGVGVPRPVDLERAVGLTAVGIAQIGCDAAVLRLEFIDRLKGELLPLRPPIVEFNPPPAMISSGKPEPASS